jgi:ribonuclease D
VSYQLIEDQQALNILCQQLAKSDVLAIDTEFVRTRTYYPNLGLLQVYNGEELALIDPLAIDDLSPFWRLLDNANIRKVLHACSEDLEVFLSTANCKPVNLIDSQIMMSFLGHGISMGYAAMVQHFTEVELDKSESRTDWLKRPLTTRQLAYASADVTHLYEIYPQLAQQLSDKNLLDSALEETQKLVDKKFSPINEDLLYLDIKQSWRLTAEQLNRLKHLAKWRYNRAKQRNLPLSFIAKDSTLIALAQRNPKNVGFMISLEGVEMLDARHQGKAMLVVLKQAEQDTPAQYPAPIVRLDQYPGYKGIYKKVKNFIEQQAKQADLAVEILASKKQINKFLSWHFKLNSAEQHQHEVDILQGWRWLLFGKKLQAFAENNFSEL